jgi:4a-hydroxytetrahydrobiopterin dehydratase
MNDLPTKCVPCEGGVPMISEERAGELAREHVPEWTLEHPRLRRTFVLGDFRRALAFTNRVGMLAEQEGHHPDFHITGWNRVTLELWTHAIGGLSENDFVLARKIDELWRRARR